MDDPLDGRSQDIVFYIEDDREGSNRLAEIELKSDLDPIIVTPRGGDGFQAHSEVVIHRRRLPGHSGPFGSPDVVKVSVWGTAGAAKGFEVDLPHNVMTLEKIVFPVAEPIPEADPGRLGDLVSIANMVVDLDAVRQGKATISVRIPGPLA